MEARGKSCNEQEMITLSEQLMFSVFVDLNCSFSCERFGFNCFVFLEIRLLSFALTYYALYRTFSYLKKTTSNTQDHRKSIKADYTRRQKSIEILISEAVVINPGLHFGPLQYSDEPDMIFNYLGQKISIK